MTTVTEKEFETVEREETKYKCEQCGAVVEEDSIHTQLVGVGDRHLLKDEPHTEKQHVCEQCQPLHAKLEQQSRHERAIEVGRAIGRGFTGIFTMASFLLGGLTMAIVGMSYVEESVNVWEQFVVSSVFGFGITFLSALFFTLLVRHFASDRWYDTEDNQ